MGWICLSFQGRVRCSKSAILAESEIRHHSKRADAGEYLEDGSHSPYPVGCPEVDLENLLKNSHAIQ